MIVDAHVHFVPPELTSSGGGADPSRPVVRVEHGRQVGVSLAGREMGSIVGELSRAEVVLEEAAAVGVDRMLLSPWVSTLPLRAEPDEASEACRAINTAMSATVAAHPDRLYGLGAVPMQSPEAAVGELARAVSLGLAGVEITASTGGVYLGDDRYRPFWEAAEELSALVFVHPTTKGMGMDVFDDHYLWNSVANPIETAVAGAQMVVSGVLERHRDLRVVLAHGGGVLPALAGRLGRAYDVRPEARSRCSEPPAASMRRFYYDTVTHDASLLAQLVAFAGADHVVLGSDHPFDMGTERPVEAVRALGLAADDEAAVLGGNVARLLGLEGGPGRRGRPGQATRRADRGR
ncbi:MAG: amidohydrolase family protein [Acidimicrobiales bacterium]